MQRSCAGVIVFQFWKNNIQINIHLEKFTDNLPARICKTRTIGSGITEIPDWYHVTRQQPTGQWGGTCQQASEKIEKAVKFFSIGLYLSRVYYVAYV